jgi:hypothetical protein
MLAVGKYLEDPETGKRLIIEAVEKDHVLCKAEPRQRASNASARERPRERRPRASGKA